MLIVEGNAQVDNQRVNSYDLLKIAGTIIIVCTHYQQFTKTVFTYGVNFYGGKFSFGYFVEMFFIVSGLLAARGVLKSQASGCRVSFKEYISRKIIRLLPMTGITAIVYEIAIYYFSHYTTREWVNRGTVLSFWGTVTNIIGMQIGWSFKDYKINSITWYVSVLLLCHILYFFIDWLAARCRISVIYLVIGMILLGVGIISYKINLPFLNGFTGRGYSSFFVGILMGYYPPRKSYQRMRQVAFLAFGAIAMVLALAVFKYSLVKDGIGFTMTFIFFPALVWLMGLPGVVAFLNNRIIERLAVISFDVYVWQLVGILILLTVHDVYRLDFPIESRTTMLMFVVFLYLWGFVSNRFITQPVTDTLRKIID